MLARVANATLLLSHWAFLGNIPIHYRGIVEVHKGLLIRIRSRGL